jgi:hypothetical protein
MEAIYTITEWIAKFLLGAMILGGGIIMNILIWGGLYHLIRMGASQ